VTSEDRDLGLGRAITRRDFLNGIAMTAGGLAAAWWAELGPGARAAAAAAPYPPALTGLRGSADGTYEVAHELRDGTIWKKHPAAADTGERYDLVVVGGGLSGLAAAYFFRARAGRRARILILDNHDDFGGHARRNEFSVAGRLLIGYGGTMSIESPKPYSREARRLMTELGIDPPALEARAADPAAYRSLKLGEGIFFDRETFGTDRLVAGAGDRPWREFLADAPLSSAARRDIARVEGANVDYLSGASTQAKRERLSSISYKDFLLTIARVSPDVIPFYQARTHDLYGVGVDAVPALDCWAIGLPGFQGLNLEAGPGGRMSVTAAGEAEEQAEPYHFHFPDGNASVARLLVRSLVPAAMPGRTVEDLVTARANYDRLDAPGADVRIRLGSTAVRARHVGPARRHVEVEYVRDGRLSSVRGAACVLACWNSVIPHLCPELPAAQQDALRYGVKVPLVYTNVALRRWDAFATLRLHAIHAPGAYHTSLNLDSTIQLGRYASARAPEEPIVLHMLRTPCLPGLPAREQHRAGRVELLSTTFETFERQIRDQLARMLGGGGFDPARDIAGITVNRWAHGYAYEYNPLWDPDWPEDRQPCVIARRPFGRIAIANSDAGAYAYTDGAIDQAYRAVDELISAQG
jgi:spermidine dehydrogenase